jgi:hypothetical protein
MTDLEEKIRGIAKVSLLLVGMFLTSVAGATVADVIRHYSRSHPGPVCEELSKLRGQLDLVHCMILIRAHQR